MGSICTLMSCNFRQPNPRAKISGDKPSMAIPASALLSSTPKFQMQLIKLCKHQPGQLQSCSLWAVREKYFRKCSKKIIMAQMGDPDKVRMQLSIVRERLLEAVPEPVKDFPWKKAETLMLERLLFRGRKAFKWSLLVLFVFSFLSDAVFAIARNQELMIPLGLLVGCLMTDFLRESLEELFRGSEGKVLQRNLLGLGCFFLFVKVLSTYFALQGQLFFVHVANGGFTQVLWLWRSLVEERDEGDEDYSTSNQDAHIAIVAED